MPTPLYRAMQDGKLCRLEELTRMGSDVQDTLITVLSEKMMPIPELNSAIYAQRGFNVIATANNRDKGVNELSSALKRRFNVVVLPLPDDMDEEVRDRLQAGRRDGRRARPAGAEECRRGDRPRADHLPRIAVRRDRRRQGDAEDALGLAVDRRGDRDDGRRPQPGGVVRRRQAVADGLAASLVGAIVKDPVQDKAVLEEYLETVLKKRPDYAGYYTALNAAI